VSPSYFTRLVRLSYLAPDIIQAIPRRPPAAQSDRGQAAGVLAFTACLAQAVLGFASAPELLRILRLPTSPTPKRPTPR